SEGGSLIGPECGHLVRPRPCNGCRSHMSRREDSCHRREVAGKFLVTGRLSNMLNTAAQRTAAAAQAALSPSRKYLANLVSETVNACAQLSAGPSLPP